ncbi:hypothetical protein BH11MYX2_BH11MYX2_40130 [soil metagenome]
MGCSIKELNNGVNTLFVRDNGKGATFYVRFT